MVLSENVRESLKREIVDALTGEKEIRRIMIFGSFPGGGETHDIDVAVFQDSSESYLDLALKYRRKTRHVSRQIPVDILPISAQARPDTVMMKEIMRGVTIYEG